MEGLQIYKEENEIQGVNKRRKRRRRRELNERKGDEKGEEG